MEQNKEALELLESAEKALQSSGQDKKEMKVQETGMAESTKKEAIQQIQSFEHGMIMFKRELLNATIKKDAKNPFAKSEYITLDNILNTIKPVLAKVNGDVEQNIITPDIEILQYLGDSQNYIQCITTFYFITKNNEVVSKSYKSWIQPIDKNGNLSQSYGSAITYLKRYHLSAILGIAENIDDDGNSSGEFSKSETITKNQENILETEIRRASERSGMDYKQLITAIIQEYHIPSLSKLRVSNFESVINRLKNTK